MRGENAKVKRSRICVAPLPAEGIQSIQVVPTRTARSASLLAMNVTHNRYRCWYLKHILFLTQNCSSLLENLCLVWEFQNVRGPVTNVTILGQNNAFPTESARGSPHSSTAGTNPECCPCAHSSFILEVRHQSFRVWFSIAPEDISNVKDFSDRRRHRGTSSQFARHAGPLRGCV